MNEAAPALDPEQYIAERVKQYQAWYDRKAVATKSRYLQMRAFSVIGGGLVPVLVNVPAQFTILGVSIIQALVTIISLLVVIVVSLESVFHYREQWKNYRSTEQLLGHEQFEFLAHVGVYKSLSPEEAFQLFVEKVEDAISSENAATLNVMAVGSQTVPDRSK